MTNWIEPELQTALDTLQEWQHVALVLYGEARSESIDGIVGVGTAIRNRALHPGWWGKNFSEVVLKPYQFSCLNPIGGERNYERVKTLALKLAANEVIQDKKGAPDQKWLTCAWVARGIVGGFLPDEVKSANHYHVANMTPRPEWAQKAVPVAQRGNHVFYRL
jgi:N-acetylmuramoyl-L-alanine amidase